MELDIFDKYNEEAYKKVKNMLKTTNIATVIHPDFTRIEDIGVKFISETAGRTLCLEQRRNKRGKIQQKIERLIREGKISEEKLPRYEDVEFLTYSELMTKITSGEDISGYENIVLSDLCILGESTWKNGIDVLLDRNSQAKTLQLVEYGIVNLRNKKALLQRVRGNIASFIPENEAARNLSYSILVGQELRELKEEIKNLSTKINKLKDKELKSELRYRIEEAEALWTEWQEKFQEELDLDELDKLLYRDDNESKEKDIMSDEEFEEEVNIRLYHIAMRDKIREILNSIRIEMGLEPENSELEQLRLEYKRLSGREDEAKKLLAEIEKVKGKEGEGREEGEER